MTEPTPEGLQHAPRPGKGHVAMPRWPTWSYLCDALRPCLVAILGIATGFLWVALLLAVLLTISGAGRAETHRSRQTPIAFMRHHPCPGGPDWGRTRGACRGYVRDHIVPLCANGPDTEENMQWQTVKAGKAKDVLERRQCGLQRLVQERE